MTRLFSGPTTALNAINVGILAAGFLVSARLESPHAFERTGALVSAFTGLFVVLQVIDELRMERVLFHADEERAEPPPRPPIERTAVNLERNNERRKESAVRQARLTLIVFIAFWLSLGETIHGFGDLLFEYAGRLGDTACGVAGGAKCSLTPDSEKSPGGAGSTAVPVPKTSPSANALTNNPPRPPPRGWSAGGFAGPGPAWPDWNDIRPW
jgi:hypothetical protein